MCDVGVITLDPDFPTFRSTPHPLIERGFYRWPAGPPLWQVCETCNTNDHRCHFCGDILRHAETMIGPNYHACYLSMAVVQHG